MTIEGSRIFIGLMAAHFLGDFVFQSYGLVKNKKKIGFLLLHTGLVAILSWLVCGYLALWLIPVGVLLLHTCLDYCKSHFFEDGLTVFLLDQLFHVAVLWGLVMLIMNISMFDNDVSIWSDIFGTTYWSVLIIVTGFIVAIRFSGFVIKYIVAPFEKELKNKNGFVKGLSNGGMWIGWLERFLIMLLYLTGQGLGIGFLIAAKSILRYGEVKDQKDKMQAEYIIIGTLTSFGFGILTAFLTSYFLMLI